MKYKKTKIFYVSEYSGEYLDLSMCMYAFKNYYHSSAT